MVAHFRGIIHKYTLYYFNFYPTWNRSPRNLLLCILVKYDFITIKKKITKEIRDFLTNDEKCITKYKRRKPMEFSIIIKTINLGPLIVNSSP